MTLPWLPSRCFASAEPAWSRPPDPLSGGSDQVHVWRAFLDHPFVAGTPDAFLDEEERRRAARFHFIEDRQRYAAAHFVMRDVLSRYLGAPPGRIEILRTARGKPHLEGKFRMSGVRFSVSRSGNLALIAVAWNREVGIDVEHITSSASGMSLAEGHFTRQEVAVLRTLPLEQRHEAFFAFWVRKEAYLKAVGLGLSIPLDRVDTTVSVRDSIAIATPRGSASWAFHSINPGRGYAAALSTEGEEVKVRYIDWA